MISLTPRQAELARFLETERAAGRKPTIAQMGAALGLRSKGSPHRLYRAIVERSQAPAFPAFPCGPRGEPLRFIPVDALAGAPR